MNGFTAFRAHWAILLLAGLLCGAVASADDAIFFRFQPSEGVDFETSLSSIPCIYDQPGHVQPDETDWLTIRGQDEGGGDASDPTNVTFHVVTEWEWQRLNNNEGDLIAFKLSPYIPIELGEQKLLFNFEVPLPQHAGLNGLSHSSGIGDTRLRLFWLIGTEREFVRAVVPSFDAFAPTGDADRGLGGGQWILMPNVVFALQPAENWSMYPFFRYVHAEDVSTNFVTEFPLGEPAGDVFGSSELRGFNLEWVNVFALQDAGFDWLEVNPDYFKNYTGDRSETFTMKYVAAKEIKDGLFMLFEFQHPVGGDVNNDFTMKLRLDWYPNCSGGLFGRRHCH